MNNEQIIRRAYEMDEKVDVRGWVECFSAAQFEQHWLTAA